MGSRRPLGNTLLRTRSGFPIAGKLLCPQGRTSARISGGACRILRQLIHPAHRGTHCAFFVITEMEKLLIAQAGVDIELKNSMLAFDFDSRLISNSMASTVDSGLRTVRSTHTRLNSSGGRSSSSLRVPGR